MKKRSVWVVVLVVMALVGCQSDTRRLKEQNHPKTVTYTINDVPVELLYGVEGTLITRSADGVETRSYGKPAFADINQDGLEDFAQIVTQSGGGSGTFFYLVWALNSDTGYQGSSGIFLGDRIKIESMVAGRGSTTVETLQHDAGASFAEEPTVPKTFNFRWNAAANQLAVLAVDFEGESDSNRMTLSMKSWEWEKTAMNDGTSHTPNKPGAFALTFYEEDSRVNIKTDCNTMNGGYEVDGRKISFTQMMATRMYCEDSQEDLFARQLEQVTSYMFTGRGQLVLQLKYDSGVMIFR